MVGHICIYIYVYILSMQQSSFLMLDCTRNSTSRLSHFIVFFLLTEFIIKFESEQIVYCDFKQKWHLELPEENLKFMDFKIQ